MSWLDIEYLFSSAIYLMAGIPLILVLFFSLWNFRQKAIIPNFKHSQRSSYFFWLKVLCICIAWYFAAFAIMGPRSSSYINKTYQQAAEEVTLLIDVSASMDAKDAEHQSRISLAKEIADEVISELLGESVSLYAFTQEIEQISPPTTDYLYVRLMLKQLQINESGKPGTNLKNALFQIVQKNAKEPDHLSKSLVVITDGENTEAVSNQEVLQVLDQLSRQKMQLFVIGVGSDTGGIVPAITYHDNPVISKKNSALFDEIQKSGKANYFDSQVMNPLQISKEITKKLNNTIDESLAYHSYFQIPLAIAIVFLMIAMALPEKKLEVAA